MSLELAKKARHLGLRFQRKSRFVETAFQSTMSSADVHVLGDIWTKPGNPVSFYIDLVCLEQSVVSRMIQRFEAQGFVLSVKDGTSKIIDITSKGIKTIRTMCLQANDVYSHFSKSLSKAELNRLDEYFVKVGKACGVPSLPRWELDQTPRYGLRYWTRALGSLGRNVVDSGFSSSQLQALTLVEESGLGITIDEISRLLRIDASTASRNVNTLIRHGVLQSSASEQDKRVSLVRFTEEGRTSYDAVLNKLGTMIFSAFRGQQSEFEDFVDLLERFAGPSDIGTERAIPVLSDPVLIQHIKSDEPVELYTKGISLPLIWENKRIGKNSRDHKSTHAFSTSVGKSEVCVVVISEREKSLAVTHIFGESHAFMKAWSAFSLQAAEEVLTKDPISTKSFQGPDALF